MPAAKYASRNIVETNTTEYTFHIIIVKIGFPCHTKFGKCKLLHNCQDIIWFVR